MEWKREDVPVDEPLKTTDLVLDCTELECQMELNVMTSDEKDMLIKHLLSQVKECQEQIDTIAEFGEQMACDLVQAQVRPCDLICVFIINEILLGNGSRKFCNVSN